MHRCPSGKKGVSELQLAVAEWPIALSLWPTSPNQGWMCPQAISCIADGKLHLFQQRFALLTHAHLWHG